MNITELQPLQNNNKDIMLISTLLLCINLLVVAYLVYREIQEYKKHRSISK